MPALIVSMNLLLFLGLGWYALRLAKRAPWESVRLLWRIAVLPVAAVVLGGVQRLVVQAVRAGYLRQNTLDILFNQWQLVQSSLVAIIGVATFVALRRLDVRFSDLELVVGEMIDRVKDIDLNVVGLTPREREVLDAMGGGAAIDDRTLAERLSISPDTVHTHMSSLLKKTKLRDRRDLIILAFLQSPRD